MSDASDKKSPIGMNEVLAVGLGAVALWRIRNRRKREKALQEAERAKREQEGKEGADEGEQA